MTTCSTMTLPKNDHCPEPSAARLVPAHESEEQYGTKLWVGQRKGAVRDCMGEEWLGECDGVRVCSGRGGEGERRWW